MADRLLLLVLVFALVMVAFALWRRAPRQLRGLDLGEVGVPGPAIVEFTAPSCPPCKAALPGLEAASRASGVPLVLVDVVERPELARRYGIRSVPTIVVARPSGDVVRAWTGLPADEEVVRAAHAAR